MKIFQSEGKDIAIPDIEVVPGSHDPHKFLIKEGEFAGIEFTMTNMHMDEKDEALLWYDLDVTKGEVAVDKIKPVVDNYILSILYDQIERMKNETDSPSTTNP